MTTIDKALDLLELFLSNKDEIALENIARSCRLKKLLLIGLSPVYISAAFLNKKRFLNEHP
jgi:hypothetical protein